MASTLDGTYGWRARIGFITVASTLETPAYEFQMMAPPGMVLVSAHCTIRRVERDSIAPAREALSAAATELGQYHIDHIVVSGAPLAYWSEEPAKTSADLTEATAAASGVGATFEWPATVEALRSVDALRIAVATPFTEENNERISWALEGEGFDVAAIEGKGLRTNPEFTTEPLRSAYDMAKRAVRRAGQVDALYISCPRWPVAPVIALLEEELGLPVIASVPAWLWKVMDALSIGTPVRGYGCLLERSRPPAGFR